MKKTIITCLAVVVSLCVLHADPAVTQPVSSSKNCYFFVNEKDNGKTIELPLDRKLAVHLKSEVVWCCDEKAENHWNRKGGSLKVWMPKLVDSDEAGGYTEDHILKLNFDDCCTSEPIWETGKKAPCIQEGISHDEFVFTPQQEGDTKVTFHLMTMTIKKGTISEKCSGKFSFNVHVVEVQTPPAPVAPTEPTTPVAPTIGN